MYARFPIPSLAVVLRAVVLLAVMSTTGLFASRVEAATITYQTPLANTCSFCGATSPGSGSLTIVWDDTTFTASYAISYSGLLSSLQVIRFHDPVTGANYNGQIGPLFPDSGEGLAGSQSGTLTWFSVYDGFVDAGDLAVGLATLEGTTYEIGGTLTVVPEPSALTFLGIGAMLFGAITRRRSDD